MLMSNGIPPGSSPWWCRGGVSWPVSKSHSARLGGPGGVWVMRLAILAAVLLNVAMLPCPGWFRVMAVAGVSLGGVFGGRRFARRPRSEHTLSVGDPPEFPGGAA